MNKKELACALVEKFPRLSKRELAKRLVEGHPDRFKGAEDARFCIRSVTGSAGKTRAIMTDKYIGPRLDPGEHYDNSPYVLTGSERIGIVSDVHIPYHARKELYMALSWLKEQEIDTLILNGDIIDACEISTHEKSWDVRPLWHEIKILHNFLDDLRDNFPTQKIIYKLANHERRLKRYLARQAGELASMPIMTMDYLVKIRAVKCENHKGDNCEYCGGRMEIIEPKDRNLIIVSETRAIHCGKLDVIHGDESKGGGVSPARNFMLKRKVSTLGGHFHRSSEQLWRDARGSVGGAWSTGCLCELTPQWLPENEWNHGFAMVELEGDQFTVHNKKIINGRVV